MSINQNDLRVIKTKRGLREAFVRLLLEKDYDAISIQDIATEAETARVTFYRHYKNKEELLGDCLNVTFEDLAERVEHATRVEQASGGNFQQGYSPLLTFYEHIQEQETLYHILFSSLGTQIALGRLKKLLAERLKHQIIKRFPGQQFLAPLDIIAYHFASAQIGLAVWWLQNGKPYSSEYMAKISFWLNMAGSARGLGYTGLPVAPPPLS